MHVSLLSVAVNSAALLLVFELSEGEVSRVYLCVTLTPSLPQPIKFSELNDAGTRLQTVQCMSFDENLFTCQCEEDKKA